MSWVAAVLSVGGLLIKLPRRKLDLPSPALFGRQLQPLRGVPRRGFAAAVQLLFPLANQTGP